MLEMTAVCGYRKNAKNFVVVTDNEMSFGTLCDYKLVTNV